MDIINSIQNILVKHLDGTLMGPCVYSQEFDPKTLTNMDVVTFEVTNGAKIRGPLPFGMFAEVTPMNINKSKLVLKVSPHTSPIFNELRGQRTDKELWAPTQYTEQIVAPDSTFENDPLVEYAPIDEYLSLKTTRVTPTAALNAYVLRYPTKLNMDIPRVLTGVRILWNTSNEVGTQTPRYTSTAAGNSWTVSGNIDDSANSSAGFMPEIQIDYDDYAARNLYGTAYAFFMPQSDVTLANIITKLNALTSGTVTVWPTFRLKSTTITGFGQTVGVRANAQSQLSITYKDGAYTATTSGGSTSTDKRCNMSVVSTQIPPMLCAGLTIAGDLTKSQSVSATATINLYSHIPAYSSLSTITATSTAAGSISPSTIPATQTLPIDGLYLVDVKVAPYDWGYVKVYAEVFNAAQLEIDITEILPDFDAIFEEALTD